MTNEHSIIQKVNDAKENVAMADELIRSYLPFINAEVSRFLNRFVSSSDDELSIGMMAFHEAILGYTSSKGTFLNYAALTIKSRLIDFQRSQSRHSGILSFDQSIGDQEDSTLHDVVASDIKDGEQEAHLQATKQEILELTYVLKGFGLSLSDVADNSPKQERTLEKCKQVIRYARDNPEILEELHQTKKLPLKKLVDGSQVDRKTIERHRKYVLTMLIILSNGYDIIRGHLVNVIREKGGFTS